MAIFFELDNLPRFNNPVLTIGTFDGVHKGHKAILREVATQTRRAGGESVLITFEPHPRKLFFPHQSIGLITPLEEKLRLISDTGINHIFVVPFDRAFANLDAESYIRDFLVEKFHPHAIVIGYDHRFGHDRSGNYQLLAQYADTYYYKLIEIPEQLVNEAAISSTKIRNAIKDGRMEIVTQMLERNFSLFGTVIHGRHLGLQLGFPTANLELYDHEQIIPALGVYAIYAIVNHKRHKGMLNIGYNPTVTDEKTVKIEANIFDFSKDIYGQPLEIQFVKKIREELKFNNLDELKQQIAMDKVSVQELLGM